jgi:hypothetical protein
MKCSALICLCKGLLGDFERLNWGKTFYNGFLKGVCWDWLVKLPVPSVRAIHWLEWDQLSRVRYGDKSDACFFFFRRFIAVFELVWCARKGSRYTPWSGESILKLVNVTSSRIWFYCAPCTDNIADGVNSRIRMTGINELAMVGTLFADKELSNLATSR